MQMKLKMIMLMKISKLILLQQLVQVRMHRTMIYSLTQMIKII